MHRACSLFRLHNNLIQMVFKGLHLKKKTLIIFRNAHVGKNDMIMILKNRVVTLSQKSSLSDQKLPEKI